MCDDYTNHLLECILDRLESDEYEPEMAFTIGGSVGSYMLRSPYNTEAEWGVVALTASPQPNFLGTGAAITTLLDNNGTATSFTSGDISVATYTTLDLIIVFTSFTGGASPTIQYFIDRKDDFGNYVPIWQSAALTAATNIVLTIGGGVQNGSNAAATVQSVGIDFGDTVRIRYVTTGAPTSVTQAFTLKFKTAQLQTQSSVLVMVSGADPSTVGTSTIPNLGLTASGSDGNPYPGYVVLLNYGTQYVPFLLWHALGRGANLYMNIVANNIGGASNFTGAVYAQIAFRRKIDKYLPQMPRMYPSTHSQPQSRRALRQLPAQSAQVAGFESQYPSLQRNKSSYQHDSNVEGQDTRNIGNAIKRLTRHGP